MLPQSTDGSKFLSTFGLWIWVRSQYLPSGQHPLHQRPHAQLAGDGQGLIQQRPGLSPVSLVFALSKHVGIVAAGPGQLRPVASPAERQSVLEVVRRLEQVTRRLGQEALDCALNPVAGHYGGTIRWSGMLVH